MTTITVTLDFACTECHQPVSVTVQCSSPQHQGPLAAERIAAVKVPCPGCGEINQLCFEPNGRVRSVRPYPCFRVPPGPSIN